MVYDSLHNPTYLNGLALTLSHMFPTKNSYVVQRPYIYFPQVSVNDCGLFALAYVRSVCLEGLHYSNFVKILWDLNIERDCKEFKTNIIADYSLSHLTSMTPYVINLNLLNNLRYFVINRINYIYFLNKYFFIVQNYTFPI